MQPRTVVCPRLFSSYRLADAFFWLDAVFTAGEAPLAGFEGEPLLTFPFEELSFLATFGSYRQSRYWLQNERHPKMTPGDNVCLF
jgi:hypothetical protein